MNYKNLEFDYKDLKLRIVKYFDNQRNFAREMGMDYTALNARLNNNAEWKKRDIIKACDLLHIPHEEIHIFFYTLKVEKNSTEVA